MTSIETTDNARKAVIRPELIAVLAIVVFALAAMLRQYREITVPLSLVLALWAAFAFFRQRRTT